MAPVRVYYYGMGGGRSSVTNGVEQIDIISPLLATDFDQLYSYDYAEAVSLPVFKVGLDRQLRDLGLQDGNVKTEKIGNTFQISFSYEGRQRTVIVTYGKDAKIEFPAELLNGFEVLYSRGMPVVFRDMQSAKKAVLFEQLKKQGGFLVMESIVNTPIDIEGFRRVDMGDTSWAGEARRLDVFEAASSPVTMEQIRNKVADDSQRILVDVLTTPDGKGGRQPRTVWFDYDKRLLITVFGIDNEQFRRQLQVSVLNKTISTSERLKDVINRIIGQPELVFDALNRYIIEVNNLDRLRGESGIATRRQTRINMLNDLRDALVPLVMVSKINGYISTGKVNTRGQIEMKFAPHDLTSVRQALELMPGLDAGIWESASILLIQVEPMEGSSSPIIKDTKGGIDFRSLPITAQPALNAQLSNMPTPRPLVSVNLDESWGQIQNMLKAGIIPSNERIKEYLQTCCEKKDMDQEVDKILACIADILRLQEERVVSTDSSLKEMLALLESNKPANEMQFVLAKIVVPDKELLTIAQ